MKAKLIIFLSIILLLALALRDFSRHVSVLRVNGKEISLIVVDTPKAREIGLGNRNELVENEAMLFVFDKPGFYPFWMKGMKFPIDIIWINEWYEIIHIESNISPGTYPKSFSPRDNAEKSLFVLETNAHFSVKNSMKVGDRLDIILIK